MTDLDLWRITVFTLATAGAATLAMLIPGTAAAWVLARRRFRGQVLLETFISLPLVMPPVATGLLLLMLVSPRGPFGSLLSALGIEIVFTWRGVVLAMTVMGLPLFVRSARAGFEQVDRRFEAVAATLGASPARVSTTSGISTCRPASSFSSATNSRTSAASSAS